MTPTKRNHRGRPKKSARFKKRALSLWMKEEMIDRLDGMKESLGLSSRNDMIRMLIETHPDYREGQS